MFRLKLKHDFPRRQRHFFLLPEAQEVCAAYRNLRDPMKVVPNWSSRQRFGQIKISDKIFQSCGGRVFFTFLFRGLLSIKTLHKIVGMSTYYHIDVPVAAVRVYTGAPLAGVLYTATTEVATTLVFQFSPTKIISLFWQVLRYIKILVYSNC